jgi:hypothetical protein
VWHRRHEEKDDESNKRRELAGDPEVVSALRSPFFWGL